MELKDLSIENRRYVINIKADMTDDNRLEVLKTNDYMNSPFDEYLVIELYTPTNLNEFDSKHLLSMGYPKGPNQSGIRIWHVDSRLMEMSRFDYSFATEIKTGSSYLFANSNSTDSTYGTSFDECKDYRLLLLRYDINHDIKHTFMPVPILFSSTFSILNCEHGIFHNGTFNISASNRPRG